MAIGTSQAFRAQNLRLLGNFYDKTDSIGNVGYRLNSTGDGTKWLADTNQSSGILTGGVLSATIGGTTFNVSAGTGQIVTNSLVGGEVVATYTKVSWNAQNSVALTYRTSHQFSYIYIDENGALQQQNSSFTDAEYRNKIILGVICHINLSTINLVTNRQNIAYGDSHRIYELVSSFGPIKRSGLAISAYSTNLRITRAAGVVFSLGCNYASDQFDADSPSISAANPALLCRVYQNGSGGFIFDVNSGSYYTDIDPNKYDNGSGTLQTVNNNQWTIQRLYFFPNNPTDVITYYGRAIYNSYADAVGSIATETFSEATITAENAVFLGYLVVRGGATNLSTSADAVFFQSGAFRNIGAGGAGGGGGGASPTTLDDLSDVSISSPSDSQFLIYDNTTSLWRNATLSATSPITFSGVGTSLTLSVSNNAINFNKIQQIATSRVLGRISSGTGDVEELTGANIATIIDTNFVTNATNATNTTVTDDIATNASMYLTWVTATTGNLPQKVSSTKLTFNPSSGTLVAGVFSGSGASLTSLNASNLSSGTVPGDRGITAGSATSSFVEYNGTTATAGQFDGGTTNPSGTTRLNYGGYLYATRFYGDGSNLTGVTGSSFGSQTANTFFAAPNGSAGNPTFRAIVAADIPTLNQNTTGNADTATTSVNLAGGVAGTIVYQANTDTTGFTDAGSAGQVLISDAANKPKWSVLRLSSTARSIFDSGNNELIKFPSSSVASAVNEITITNAATGSAPSISASGDDTHINLDLISKGTGNVLINGKIISLANSFTTSGNFPLSLGLTGATSLTLPTTGTLATTSNKLSDFASTTSAELAGVISDETGSGLLVFATSPTFTTSLVTDSSSFNLFNTTATTISAFGAATSLTIGATTGTTTIRNDLRITGDLTVNGTTTTVNSTVVTIDDPILTLGGDTSVVEVTKDRGIEFKWNGTTLSITNYIGNGTTTVTGTVASTAGFAAGDIITISGADSESEQNKLNGTWKIASVPNATTFTFVISSSLANGTYTAGIGSTNKSKNGFFGLDQSSGRFTFIPQANNTSEVFSGSLGDIEVNNGYFSDIYLYDDSVPSNYLQITNSANLTQARTLSINVNDASRTISLSGNLTLANNFVTSGDNSLTLTTTATTNVTLPTTGTLITDAGSYSNPSWITALDAAKITSGTLPGDRGVTAGSANSSFVEYNGTTKTAGQFDGGTTDPTSTTRLNYDGYLYATRFYGDGSNLTGVTGSSFGSQTANTFFAAPNGSAGNPTFRAIVAADVPTLNQNTTGSAATLTTTRTLWGQNFNGSANVTGDLTSVGNITGSSGITIAAGDTDKNIIITPSGAGYTRLNGNVGIEVANPTTKLQIGTGTPTSATDGIQFGGDTSARLYRAGSGIIKSSGSFESSGYVYSTAYLQAGNNNIYPNGYTNTLILNSGNSAGNNWVTTLAIAPGGNVGIGVTSPTAKLDVVTATASSTALSVRGTNGTLLSVIDDLSDSLLSVNNSAGLPVLEVFADDRVVMGQYGQNDLVVRNNKVGIGIINPAAKLDIVGTNTTIALSFGITVPNNPLFINTYGGWSGIGMDQTTAGIRLAGDYGTGTNPLVDIGYYTSGNVSHANWVSRLRINQNGNVGVGVNNPANKLHVDGAVSIGSGFNSTAPANGLIVGGNSIIGGTSSLTTGGTAGLSIINSGAALSIGNSNNDMSYIRRNGTGIFQWQTYNGTNAGEIHLEPYGGSVGIGTTSPSNTLDVNGTTRIRSISASGSAGTIFLTTDANGVIVSRTAAQVRSDIGAGTGNGTVTSIIAGDGLSGGTITSSGTIAVDSTVVRTSGNQTIAGVKTFTGNYLSITGTNSNSTDQTAGSLTSGLRLDAGEGFSIYGNQSFFGANLDGIIFQMEDSNAASGNTDGGFVFRGYSPTGTTPTASNWMVIKSGSLVGIGTTNPATTLQIGQLTPTSATAGLQFGDDTGTRIYRSASNTLTMGGTFVATTFSGSGASLTNLPAGQLSGTIPSAVLGNSTVYIGTTAILLNRASGSQTLTGVSIDGNAATATDSNQLISLDDRTIAPNEIGVSRLRFGFTSFNNNNTSPYADYLHLRSYLDVTGGNDNLVMFRKDAIGMRIYQQAFGSATAYSSYKDVCWTDGTNTTGTWSINTTGNAANVTGTVAIANGGTGATTAPNARTNLGATTVGSNFFTLTNPSAVTFPRINADNTVSTLDAATFRTAIGAGTGSGSVTSVTLATGTTGTDVNVSNATITSSGTITLNIPDASGSARGLITTGSQTIAGEKTFTTKLVVQSTQPGIILRETDQSGTTHRWIDVEGGTLRILQTNDAYSSFATQLVIDSAGEVGIGTTAPAVLLHIGGSSQTTAAYGLRFGLDTSANLYRSASATVRTDGSLTVGGTVTELSALKYKENISPLNNILNKLCYVQPVTYNKKGESKKEYGVIAEEIAELFPELISQNDAGEIESVNYSRLTVLLIQAVKELKSEIDKLKKK